MQPALILDAEALNALANPTTRRALFDRARAILTAAHENRALVRVPAPVLAEVYRGPRFDASIDRVLTDRGIATVDLTPAIARSAGHLLQGARLSSAHAVDAFGAGGAHFDLRLHHDVRPQGGQSHLPRRRHSHV